LNLVLLQRQVAFGGVGVEGFAVGRRQVDRGEEAPGIAIEGPDKRRLTPTVNTVYTVGTVERQAMKHSKPSELELQILSLLWDRGPRTAREVMESLPDGKERAYTSVLSVMQVMEKKGLLARKREGLADRWRPAVTRRSIMGPYLRQMVSYLFSGRPSAVMQQLLEQKSPDPEEIRAMKELLKQYEEKQS
jgi:BlaI family transcriptional regulator, penicillinase repressor